MPDITFGHFESHKRIELRFPHATKLLWQTLASTTHRYLGNPEILAILVKHNPNDAEDWACAQAALDRLAIAGAYRVKTWDQLIPPSGSQR